MATPLEICIALHYWTHTTDYGRDNGDHNFSASAVVAQRDQMVEAGLLILGTGERTVRNYDIGPALETYVNALCSVPWPVQKWVMP
jgi:hypothetical protein